MEQLSPSAQRLKPEAPAVSADLCHSQHPRVKRPPSAHLRVLQSPLAATALAATALRPFLSACSDMINLVWSILVLVTAEFVVGNFANIFIVLVNYIDWVRKGKFSFADQILTALAVSRIGLLWVIIINLFVTVLNPVLQSGKENFFLTAWLITNHFSTWLAAGLSIFYLLRIANFSNLVFLRLKRRVKSVILGVLLGTLMLLLLQIALIAGHEKMRVKECEENVTWKTEPRDTVYTISNVAVLHLVILVPFFTSLICFLLLIYSLCKHLRKMQAYSKGSQDPSTKAHVTALQTVISFLLLFAIYSLFVIMSVWLSMGLKKGAFFFSQVIGTLYPSCHAYVLIWGNRKLKQAFLSVLGQVKCWLREQKH
ncbi:PREDICTED: taste receptor type 2 member 31-like [Chinchilla lanigera]|uniref:taste receptor type 2 member 31-like n=1 Tax=Chinchilla lanigera TaxID=34839 RepID=UPI000697A443|nr:PREDICTED: taste receptor type 2 member 31-like [Chinchilla lanigera]